MKGSGNHPKGQSVVETVILLPVLLVVLAGGYWIFRNLDLAGASESAAHSHMIRTGRKLPSINARLSRTIHPEDGTVRIQGKDVSLAARLPLFNGLSGITVASATVSLLREPVGGFIDLPAHSIRREADGAVDCWGKTTRSGSVIRRTVTGIVVSGAFR